MVEVISVEIGENKSTAYVPIAVILWGLEKLLIHCQALHRQDYCLVSEQFQSCPYSDSPPAAVSASSALDVHVLHI